MSQNGSLGINSARQAWVTVTSTKEALSRRSGQTRRSPPKSQLNYILSKEVTFSRCYHKEGTGLYEKTQTKAFPWSWSIQSCCQQVLSGLDVLSCLFPVIVNLILTGQSYLLGKHAFDVNKFQFCHGKQVHFLY